MLSPARITRLVEQKSWDTLVRTILANGRCVAPPIRRRLAQPVAAPIAGIGLALQRLTELSYGRCPAIIDLTSRLLGLQDPEGLFVSATAPLERPVAASAVALRGLAAAWSGPAAMRPATLGDQVHAAVDRGLAALARRQSPCGRIGADLVDAAAVLWQLGDHPGLGAACRLDALRAQVLAAADLDHEVRSFGQAAA
jgi:hypothetical protein